MQEINATQAQNQTAGAVSQEGVVTPGLEHAYVSAAYAQGLEIRIKELNERIIKLQENQQPPFVNSIFSALDAHIKAVVAEAMQVNIDRRIKDIADEVARDVLSEHVGEYDYDMYDRLEDKLDDKINDAIDEYDFEDKINDVLRNATVTIEV